MYGFQHMINELQESANSSVWSRHAAQSGLWSTGKPICRLLCALASTSFPVRSLRLRIVEGRVNRRGSPDASQVKVLPSVDDLAVCFSTLTSLTLRIEANDEWESKEHYVPLRCALAGAANLREVTFGASGLEDGTGKATKALDSLTALISKSATIDSLNINEFWFSQAKLHAFLGNFVKTVKKLEIIYFHFNGSYEEDQEWEDTFAWIAENFTHLEHFAAERLYDGHLKMKGRVELTDKWSMAEDLRRLAKRIVFEREGFQRGTLPRLYGDNQ